MTELPRMPTLNIPPLPGLLEQGALRLRPSAEGALLLAESGHVVGFSRRCSGGLWRGWPWPSLEVREQEESPLVCTIRRRLTLWPRHDVRDAEGELVGVLAGRWILDRWQRATMRVRAHQGGGHFLDTRGDLLARWADDDGEARLELLPAVQHDPFAKMLVVAAVVVR